MIRFRRKNSAQGLAKTDDRPESAKHILKVLASIAIPITLSASMVSIITLIDTSLVQGQLQNALGYTLHEPVRLLPEGHHHLQPALGLHGLPDGLYRSRRLCGPDEEG